MLDITLERAQELHKRALNVKRNTFLSILNLCGVLLTIAIDIAVVVYCFGFSKLPVEGKLLILGLSYIPMGLMTLFMRHHEINDAPVFINRATLNARKFSYMDFTSDETIRKVSELRDKTSLFTEKCSVSMRICDMYLWRGQLGEAMKILSSVDRSAFKKNPTLAVDFYTEAVEIYAAAGDTAGALAAFADGEPFFDKCGSRNYICLMHCLVAMCEAEKCRGNYSHALDIQLMRLKLNSGDSLTAPVTPFGYFLAGVDIVKTAELYFLCGDINKAAELLDQGGPMVWQSPYYTALANNLGDIIRQRLSGTN